MSYPAPDRPGLPRPQADPGADVDTAPLRCCRIAASLPGLPGKYPPSPPPGTPSCFRQSSEPARAVAPGLPNGSGSRPLPWSQARAVNCAVLRLVQHTGVTASRWSSRSAGPRPRSSTIAARETTRAARPQHRSYEPNDRVLRPRAGITPYGSGEPDRDGVGYGDRIPPFGLVRLGHPHSGTPMWLRACRAPIAYADAPD